MQRNLCPPEGCMRDLTLPNRLIMDVPGCSSAAYRHIRIKHFRPSGTKPLPHRPYIFLNHTFGIFALWREDDTDVHCHQETMLSLIHLSVLAGTLSVSVQGAVVLDGRPNREPGPAIPASADPIIITGPISSATDTLHLPTFTTEDTSALSTVQVAIDTSSIPSQQSTFNRPQVTKEPKIFSPPLFTPLPIGTPSVKRLVAGGNGTIIQVNSTTMTGSPVSTDRMVFQERFLTTTENRYGSVLGFVRTYIEASHLMSTTNGDRPAALDFYGRQIPSTTRGRTCNL
ncbi:hypothetical protein DFS33DRAFT_1447685 [Desarmillaria ectypa]|nr:hypothetical protein DFS33DRAFT_1447685 [Desarmillaria ectypa]